MLIFSVLACKSTQKFHLISQTVKITDKYVDLLFRYYFWRVFSGIRLFISNSNHELPIYYYICL